MLRLVKEEYAMAGTFEDFWLIYPKKVAKKDAKAAWLKAKVTPEIWDRIVVSIEQHKRSDNWTDRGGMFIPYAATWLNGERWDDEIEVVVEVTPCSWPRCKALGKAKHGSRDFCEAHIQALKRGETP